MQSAASALLQIGEALVDAQVACLRLVRALDPGYLSWPVANVTGDDLVVSVWALPNLTPSERYRIAEAMVHEDEATLRVIWEEATARLCAPGERVPGRAPGDLRPGQGESQGETAG